jgi:hypothetical protein
MKNSILSGTTRMESQLRSRLGGQLRDFRLCLRDHCLVLQGQAHTYYAKQLAQHVAAEMTGLPVSANEIEVV